jgi:tRNA (cmo5U34)-methyltransferase
MSIDKEFNQSAQVYDEWMHKAIPHHETLFTSAKNLPPFPDDAPIRVLDLGAGTGSFSAHILSRYVNARFTLVDLAPNMLDVARQRFHAFSNQFEYIVDDIRHLADLHDFDLVISSLAIHHLDHPGKQALFKDIYTSLNPTGLFINVDQIHAPTPALREYYWNAWLKNVRQNNAAEDQIETSVRRRTTYDQDALLVDQLLWLQNAGFAHVDIIYKDHFIGVFYAAKA